MRDVTVVDKDMQYTTTMEIKWGNAWNQPQESYYSVVLPVRKNLENQETDKYINTAGEVDTTKL